MLELNGNLITVHVDKWDGSMYFDEMGNAKNLYIYRIHDKAAGTPRAIIGAHPFIVMDILQEMQENKRLIPEMGDTEFDMQVALGTLPETGCELRANNGGCIYTIQAEQNGQPVGEIMPLALTHFNGHRV